MRLARTVIAAVLLFFGLPVFANADTFAIGYVSLDIFIAGSPLSPGVNQFTIGNFTGGSAIPPTFPVLTPLTFRTSSLVLVKGGISQTVLLGDIDPGISNPVELEFPDTDIFSSATFSATLDTLTLDLDGGGSITLFSPTIEAALLPSAGGNLVPGTDFVLLTVSDEVPAVPEPSSYILFATVIVATFRLRRHRHSS